MHGNVHTIPKVEQVAPGVVQVAHGASRVAPVLAQVPGVLGNPYANYYRILLSYDQSHYANRNQ